METLTAAFYPNIPMAFRYQDRNGNTQLAGAFAQTMKYFAKYRGYNLRYEPISNYKVSHVQMSIQNGVYNTSMYAMSYKNVFANISFSYPLEWSRVCVMVPSEEELPRYWYVVWPFGRYIWTVLGLAVLYIALLMSVLKHPSSKFVQNLLSSMAVVLYSSNMNLKLVNVAQRLQMFYTLLLIMGFILSSYYCSYLTVYNMRPIFQPYPRTADEIIKANHEIWIPSHILEELRNNPAVNLTRFEPLIVEKSKLEISNNVRNLSRSHAYTVTHSEWVFVEKLQRHLIQPAFQLSDICPINTFNAFPIPNHASFANDLDLFILLVQQSGLWEFWEEKAFVVAIRSRYFRVFLDSYPLDPLNMYYYRIAWIIFFGGMISSICCIAMELAVFKHRHRLDRRRSSTWLSLLQEYRRSF